MGLDLRRRRSNAHLQPVVLVHPQGCGFVHFADRRSAEAALEMNGGQVMGSTVRVSWGRCEGSTSPMSFDARPNVPQLGVEGVVGYSLHFQLLYLGPMMFFFRSTKPPPPGGYAGGGSFSYGGYGGAAGYDAYGYGSAADPYAYGGYYGEGVSPFSDEGLLRDDALD